MDWNRNKYLYTNKNILLIQIALVYTVCYGYSHSIIKKQSTRLDFTVTNTQKTALIGAFGLIISAWILAQALIDIKTTANQSIAVTGASYEQVQSDYATWSVQVSADHTDRKQAYKQLQHDIQTVFNYLTRHGLKAENLTIDRMDTNTQYIRDHRGYNTHQISGYKLYQSIQIQTDDIKTIETLAHQINELLNDGLNIESNSPQYLYTKLNDLKVRKLGEAIEDAKARAKSMAEHSGSKVGTMQSARMGVFQITAPYSNDVSDYGINDTSSIDKKVTAVVNVRFHLK